MTTQPSTALDPIDPMVTMYGLAVSHFEAAEVDSEEEDLASIEADDLARQLTERLNAAVPADHVVVSREDALYPTGALTHIAEWLDMEYPESKSLMDLYDKAESLLMVLDANNYILIDYTHASPELRAALAADQADAK